MAIKVYKCEKCEKVVEVFHPSINDPEATKCECGGKLNRNYSDNKVGLMFSGSYKNNM